MTNALFIQVTEDQLAEAIRRDSSHCMIADAIRAAVPDALRISVDLQTIRFTRGRRRLVYLTPRSAQLALLRFDDGDPTLEPFRFRLPAPAQILQARGTVKRTDMQTRVGQDAGSGPVRRGGKTPPLGPLLGGDEQVTVHAGERTTGRIRRYGLRGMGRA
jgi:hypothetical protein